MALSSQDFTRCFANLEQALANCRLGRSLTAGELGLMASSAHALRRVLEAGVVPADAQAGLASWHEAILGYLPINIEISGLLTIGYHPKNVLEGDARAGQTLAMNTISAARALEAGGQSLRSRPTLWDLLEGQIGRFTAKHLENGQRTTRDAGTWWMVCAIIDLLTTIGPSAAWVAGRADDLTTLCSKYRANLVEYASRSGLGAYFDQLVRRGAIKVPSVGRSPKANELGQLLQALDAMDSDQIPENIPPIGGWNPTPLHWVVHAYREALDGEFPPGQPFLNLEHPADTLYATVWKVSAASANATVTPEEITYVSSLRDEGIRSLLLAIFGAHELVPIAARANLEHELGKPNAGAEIADAMVPLDTAHGRFAVAIPIKSGVEVRGKSAAKIGEEYIHQFERPLNQMKWQQVVCYPLVLSGITLNARELETRLGANSRRGVRFVEAAAFVRILRANGLPTRKA